MVQHHLICCCLSVFLLFAVYNGVNVFVIGQTWIRSNAMVTKNCGQHWKNVTSMEWSVTTDSHLMHKRKIQLNQKLIKYCAAQKIVPRLFFYNNFG